MIGGEDGGGSIEGGARSGISLLTMTSSSAKAGSEAGTVASDDSSGGAGSTAGAV